MSLARVHKAMILSGFMSITVFLRLRLLGITDVASSRIDIVFWHSLLAHHGQHVDTVSQPETVGIDALLARHDATQEPKATEGLRAVLVVHNSCLGGIDA